LILNYSDSKYIVKIQPVYSFWEHHFKAECLTYHTLSHFKISPDILAGWITNEIGYIILERIQGITLKDYLSSRHSLSPAQLYRLYEKIWSMHRMGIIHGDLHTNNVNINELFFLYNYISVYKHYYN